MMVVAGHDEGGNGIRLRELRTVMRLKTTPVPRTTNEVYMFAAKMHMQ